MINFPLPLFITLAVAAVVPAAAEAPSHCPMNDNDTIVTGEIPICKAGRGNKAGAT
jgi:hypothetical protein